VIVLEFRVRASVRDSWEYETPAYEKVRVRNVWKPAPPPICHSVVKGE